MSVESVLANLGTDLTKAAAKLSADWIKVKAAWSLISSPAVRSALVSVGSAAIATVNAAGAAASAKGLSLTLDEDVVADIKTLIADAKAGEGVIATDLKVLGITL